ncbi:MAG TPA: proteasome accessory factor PafA2 family protein [Fimbriimonadaceae bacterium]|nr:proteasome accessory factor PafA2 family protein [Fimbriimonadaceae bacterium]
MRRGPCDRIFGVETEFGTLVAESAGTPERVVEMIKDHVFYEQRLGLIDLHSRDDVFEPAESGGFLINGGRLYIDAVGSHLEYATAECRSLKDIVAQDRAGHRIVVRAIEELGLTDEVDVYNNSVDHFGGHTFGCHENYLVKMTEDFFSIQAPQLYPFLVTRQIFAGVGRVGGHLLAGGGSPDYYDMVENPVDYIWVSHVYHVYEDDTVPFQLSQRADHIIKTVASRVRFNRALINPKWEHFYAHEGMHRLHVLFGESNQNQYAYALKVGTTSLVLALIEDGLIPPELRCAEPIIALREVSRDQSYKWPVTMLDGRKMGAIEVQRVYLGLAQRYFGSSPDVDWVLKEWESVLDGLEKDPLAMGDRIDWVAKKKIVEEYIREVSTQDPPLPSAAKGPAVGGSSEEEAWHDDALHSVDLEYHNIDPAKSLFGGYAETSGVRSIVEDADIVLAQTDPPPDTRAKGRSELVRKIIDRRGPRFYVFDWSGVAVDRHNYVEMPDPFETYSR